ncbi:D-alanyl-D-alanine carboxypeptidase family protein [Aliidiomarina haloalkalitolerans]|uniref:serine-type D-Ala-D-Ala carboxypeptidase n=1 Tax=Aliidiomarina haloalkalitolerans TaxID=859059 RepID=A0A432VZB4_9GAMM|nr:D-alanyl-D-alanine carboxypeptidase family protein [Aliidiomarina haloalkalitolerans]MCL4409901.1 D-alanyl-D-alanine carboxypeptidase [Gammaproteobacteria bacterium]RUO22002.1 D-alanyl-D-alanine carboxypeptidase [Aliidiomarina haloalkalitolerans]
MKNSRLVASLVAAVTLTVTHFTIPAHAQGVVPPTPTVNAKAWVLMDYKTGQIIAGENIDEGHGPASLTKMMTSYIIGKEIKSGNISLDDEVTVSRNAWARNFPGSSLMFIEVGRQVRVEDLNRGIIIASGNDACVAMAEHISGTEDAFANLMNAYARELGMHNTVFANSHGLPHPDQITTARDMAVLAQALIRDVPEEYAIYAEREFTFNGIRQYNRNSLLWDRSLNVDGIKTGFTSESGYSLVTSAVDGDTRLITVVMGTASEQARAAESKKLLNYGFRYYETVTAYEAGEQLVSQRIWGGSVDEIRLGTGTEVVVTLPRGQRQNLRANFVLDRTLEAPLAAGEVVGTVNLTLGDRDIASFPLVTLQAVEEGGFFKRIIDSIKKSFSDE